MVKGLRCRLRACGLIRRLLSSRQHLREHGSYIHALPRAHSKPLLTLQAQTADTRAGPTRMHEMGPICLQLQGSLASARPLGTPEALRAGTSSPSTSGVQRETVCLQTAHHYFLSTLPFLCLHPRTKERTLPPLLPPTSLDSLSYCTGPLSTLPPKPGFSQNGGAQPALQWQFLLLLQT